MLEIGLDTHGLHRRAIGRYDIVNFFYCSGNTGVDRNGHGLVGASDHCSDIYMISGPDHTCTRRADMLLHQQLDFAESVQMNRRKNIGIFVAERMHTTGKRMYRSKRHGEVPAFSEYLITY